ncbi:MAG TPA: CHAD domain-containing protein [Pirellulaceae bacterium]|nr:CHAD domain-containing protein [Pirellulaceae bacterium]
MPQFDKLLTDVGPDDPPAQAAQRALKTRLRAVVYYLGQVAGADDPAEQIHQLRIWTRRSAAALKLFAPLLPRRKSRRLKRTLRRLRQSAGAVRDLDVIEAQLGESLHGPLAERLKDQRRAANKDFQRLVRRWGTKGKLKRKVKRLLGCLDKQRPHHEGNGVAFAPWCRGQLAPQVKEFAELARRGVSQSDARLHEWRLATKRLKYALELAAIAMPKKSWSQQYELLGDLQDRIGRVCDALVERQRLLAWRRETSDREERKVLAGLLVDCRRRLTAAKRQLTRWWNAGRSRTAQALCRQAGLVES